MMKASCTLEPNHDMVWRDGCGVEITLTPVYRNGYRYCCQDCADGCPCLCSLFAFDEEDYRWDEPGPASERRQTDDHRLAMSLAVAGLPGDGITTIANADVIEESFPGLAERLHSLGARVE